MTEIHEIAEEIRTILDKERENRKLTFVEKSHKYSIYNPKTKKIVSNLPSVTTITSQFSIPFDTVKTSLRMTNQDEEQASILRQSWEEMGEYASNIGSYAHYKLEQYVWNLFDIEKDIRKPDYNIDEDGFKEAQPMIKHGVKLIHQITENGFIPLETECIMGSIDLGYFGQCDNIWIGKHQGKLTLLMTDYKTNKTKNFEESHFNVPMMNPFEDMLDTQLSKYFIQQPLYAQLFKDMLKDTKFKDLDFIGFRILHLRDKPTSIKIPKSVYEKVKQLYPII